MNDPNPPKAAARADPNTMEPSPPAPCTGAGRQPLSQRLTEVIPKLNRVSAGHFGCLGRSPEPGGASACPVGENPKPASFFPQWQHGQYNQVLRPAPGSVKIIFPEPD
jgi:hypothetical protein